MTYSVPSRPTEAVRSAIDSLGGTVAVARALVEGGRRVDLAGLEMLRQVAQVLHLARRQPCRAHGLAFEGEHGGRLHA